MMKVELPWKGRSVSRLINIQYSMKAIHESNIDIMDIRNFKIDVYNSVLDIHNSVMYIYVNYGYPDLHYGEISMDIHGWIMDANN